MAPHRRYGFACAKVVIKGGCEITMTSPDKYPHEIVIDFFKPMSMAAFIYATVICGVTLITLYSITVAALPTTLFVSNTLATQVSCSSVIPITIMGLFIGAGVCLIIKFLQCFPYYEARE